ncbi:LppA family lipoprotein [Mycobacterium sp. E136]|uniref:LppA family lipoprotein n=1 Tax=Mycobacterium sp. E136 TaxID=1834125 RepID=UPI0009FEC426|nr:LppA family lipoprotein [Mycobacterium sp. E136]
MTHLTASRRTSRARSQRTFSLSEQDWDDVLASAKKAADTIGATDVQTMKDQPRKHDVWFTGPAGLSLKVSYKGNLVVTGYTGRRLPETRSSPK